MLRRTRAAAFSAQGQREGRGGLTHPASTVEESFADGRGPMAGLTKEGQCMKCRTMGMLRRARAAAFSAQGHREGRGGQSHLQNRLLGM